MNFLAPEDFQNHPAWQRLEDQLQWYDRKSIRNKRWYKILRVTQLCLAASIPIIALAGAAWSKWVTAAFGGLIAVFEGVQQLNQFGPQWIAYRSTAEQLRHEKFLFLSQSGQYRNIEGGEALRLLAERVEENVSQEHARWTNKSKQTLEEKHT
ncbi:MAG: DUF4231 domain-containing protein [Desulfobaccales bacterium]